MKKLIFYNVIIIVGVIMFINVPYLFLLSDSAWVLIFAFLELILSIIAIIIGIIGNIITLKQK